MRLMLHDRITLVVSSDRASYIASRQTSGITECIHAGIPRGARHYCDTSSLQPDERKGVISGSIFPLAKISEKDMQ